MKSIPNILDISSALPLLYDEVNMLQDINRQVPGSVKYSIKRYRKQPNWQIEDSGMLIYHFDLQHPEENHLELRFCVSGNYYCREKLMECDRCKFSESSSCIEKIETVDVLSFIYTPSYLNHLGPDGPPAQRRQRALPRRAGGGRRAGAGDPPRLAGVHL
jgi:hypothetical protein